MRITSILKNRRLNSKQCSVKHTELEPKKRSANQDTDVVFSTWKIDKKYIIGVKHPAFMTYKEQILTQIYCIHCKHVLPFRVRHLVKQ
jgi:hypothetical protein